MSITRTLANGERWQLDGGTWHMVNHVDYAPLPDHCMDSYASCIAAQEMEPPRPTPNLNRQRELCERILDCERNGTDASASAVELARLALAYLDYREWDFRTRDA